MARPVRLGLPWYDPEDYDALRAVLVDGADLPEAYATWLTDTERVEEIIRDSGGLVVRVPVRSVAFMEWCAGAGLEADAAARARYAAESIATAD